MTSHINLVKLCVGAETVEDLEGWQADRALGYPDRLPRHVTRMWPKRAGELLAGGSIYWVIKGLILARQTVVRLDERIGEDGIRRCALVLDPTISRTVPASRRPFQGWRYLNPEDSPADLTKARESEQKLPASLVSALAEIGVR